MKYQNESQTLIDSMESQFAIFDDKGRECGYRIKYFQNEWKIADEDQGWGYTKNPTFTVKTYMTRDGMEFGATTNNIEGDDLDDCLKKADTRKRGAIKRLEKKFGAAS